jgi:hypothetical protein
MSANKEATLLDKFVTPVIIMVLAFMGTWVFTINADIQVMKKSMERVDRIAVDQRTAEKMMVLLELQTKANTELVNEIKHNQKEMTDVMYEMKMAIAICCSKSDDHYTPRNKRE